MNNKSWTIKLSTLDKRIKAFLEGYRQNLALLGNDPEEISYLLQNYLHLEKMNELTYLYITTTNVERRGVLKAVTFSLLSEYAQKTDTIDNLIYHVGPLLPATIESIKYCFQKENVSFLDILEIINTFINESQRRCVLIIEEFLDMANLFENFYQDFSKFIILQRNCMIILTASSWRAAERIFSNELNLLFGNFETVFLNETPFLNNLLYFKQLIQPIRPSPFFLLFFNNILGSNIMYYDLIAPDIRKYYQSRNEEETIISVIENMLYRKETYLFQRFLRKTEYLKTIFKEPGPVLQLLLSLSEGYLRKKDLLSLGICDSKELNFKLQKLIDFNYIINFGNIYKIRDSLFSFWIAHIFALDIRFPISDPQRRKSFYQKKLCEELALFKDEFFKSEIKKILQLFSAFKNDTLRLGKNRFRLPSLEQTKVVSYPERSFHLLIGEGKEIIFAGIKEQDADDNDIFDFIEKGANIKGKAVKKIFISLGILPPTARLIAKNNRLIIWDIHDLNYLLHIYNKPLVSFYAVGR